MKYEYCQVKFWADGDKSRVIAIDDNSYPNNPIAQSETFIGIFNILGQMGWRMCGQITFESRKMPTSYTHFSSNFYFERQVNEDEQEEYVLTQDDTY